MRRVGVHFRFFQFLHVLPMGLALLLPASPVLAASGPPPSRPPGPLSGLAVTVGRLGVLDSLVIREAGLEYRLLPLRFRFFPRWLPDLVPAAGIMATTKDDAYLYAGFRFDFAVGDRWWVTPQAAMGRWSQGDGFRLGGELEFRSGVEVTRRIGDRHRLGLLFYHLSNAGIYRHNPGSESLVMTFGAGM